MEEMNSHSNIYRSGCQEIAWRACYDENIPWLYSWYILSLWI